MRVSDNILRVFDNVLWVSDNAFQVFDGDKIEWTIIGITVLATLAPKLQKVKNNIDIVHDVRRVAGCCTLVKRMSLTSVAVTQVMRYIVPGLNSPYFHYKVNFACCLMYMQTVRFSTASMQMSVHSVNDCHAQLLQSVVCKVIVQCWCAMHGK